jgi:hypothetical protein
MAPSLSAIINLFSGVLELPGPIELCFNNRQISLAVDTPEVDRREQQFLSTKTSPKVRP